MLDGRQGGAISDWSMENTPAPVARTAKVRRVERVELVELVEPVDLRGMERHLRTEVAE